MGYSHQPSRRQLRLWLPERTFRKLRTLYDQLDSFTTGKGLLGSLEISVKLVLTGI
jgi:hypothetical protein